MDLQIIIDNLLNSKKLDNYFDSFISFLNFIKNNSNNNILWKKETINDSSIYLFYIHWNYKSILSNNQDIISKYFNSIVVDDKYNLLMYSGPKIFDSIRDNMNIDIIKNNINIDDFICYESHEGTIINIFYNYLNNKWYYCTKKNLDIYNSYYNYSKTHGQMLDDIIDKQNLEKNLNKDYTYHFILIHINNTFIIDIKKNELKLINVRDRKNNYKIVNNYNIDYNNITKSEVINIEKYNWTKNNSQGIILYNNDYFFKVYNNNYENLLKFNYKFKNKHEFYIWKYQNNLLTNDLDYYLIIINSINYLAKRLFRILNFFSKFNYYNGLIYYNKINQNQYHIIKNYNILTFIISKLQNYICFSNFLNLENIIFFLKKKCDPNEIFELLLIINSSNINSLFNNNFNNIIFDINLFLKL